MRTVPGDISVEQLAEALAAHWSAEVQGLEYMPEGGGAYHWIGLSGDGERWFATVDDLAIKPWLGSDLDTVFRALCQVYRAAVSLHRSACLRFVIAPVPAIHGETAVRLTPRYSLTLFPWVEGDPASWGEQLDATKRSELLRLLADLHASTWAAGTAPERPMAILGRQRLEQSLLDLDHFWDGGPFAEPLRQELGQRKQEVSHWLAEFDCLAAQLSLSVSEAVITHGEPHPGNLIRTERGIVLLDWDTLARDRPERDLWMLDDGTGSAWSAYRELTGRTVDLDAVRMYRLTWLLADLASFTAQLRGPHNDDADTRRAWAAVRRIFDADEPAPYGQQVT